MGLSRRIIIGDVHGHYEPLMALLGLVAMAPGDRLFFLGDLIDRGPDSAKVVEFVSHHQHHCVLGNHEAMLLASIQGDRVDSVAFGAWLQSGGSQTLSSYNGIIPQEHLAWFSHLPFYLDLGDLWLVHAGLDPHVPLSRQSAQQFCWIREPFHRSTKPYFPQKLIITGHTITATFPGVKPGQLAQGPGWLDIETGAYHRKSGWLTALDYDRQWVYQIHTGSGETRILPCSQAIVPVKPRGR